MTNHHALVIYDTRHGNTWKIAKALARGLARVGGITSDCQPVDAVRSDLLEDATFLLIGGPTEFFTESSHVAQFFDRIGAFDLNGKYGFAFDTHARSALTGSAARAIEHEMKRMGLRMLEPRRSAVTVGHLIPTHPGGPVIELDEGMERQFEELGERLGKELLDAPPIPARSTRSE